MKSTKEFKDFARKYHQNEAVWLSKASDLRGGARAAIALVEEPTCDAAVCDCSTLDETRQYKQAMLVRHLSQIEHVYEFRGSVDSDCLKFESLDGDLFESDFSSGFCTNEVEPSPEDYCRCFSFGPAARFKGETPADQMGISGEIDVFCVRDNGPAATALKFSITI